MTPFVPEHVEPVWHVYVVRSSRRDDLQADLARRGISTVIHYPIPPHQQACYRTLGEVHLPIASRLAGEVLSLPMSPLLAAESVGEVSEAIVDFFSKGSIS